MHVRHDRRRALCGRDAADAAIESDPHAGGFALKRTEHQFTALNKIETGPVQIRQRMEHQRRKVRGVRNQIAFAGKQAGKLRSELVVEIVFRPKLHRHLGIINHRGHGGSQRISLLV